MRIITLNVNGLRSAERRGFARWLARAEPWDVVCVQEIKCLPGALRMLAPEPENAPNAIAKEPVATEVPPPLSPPMPAKQPQPEPAVTQYIL